MNLIKIKKFVIIEIRPNEPGMYMSMHGPAVTSLLIDDKIGIVPEANLYFIGHPTWLKDQKHMLNL